MNRRRKRFVDNVGIRPENGMHKDTVRDQATVDDTALTPALNEYTALKGPHFILMQLVKGCSML